MKTFLIILGIVLAVLIIAIALFLWLFAEVMPK